MSFLSDKHLKGYSVVIEEQLEIMLAKWGCSTCNKETTTTRINMHYDLSMTALGIF
jgi:hypothetical protein